jgi:hypothetical protein
MVFVMVVMAFTVVLFTLLSAKSQAQEWNNTGIGSIIFEEAVSLPYPELQLTTCVLLILYYIA